MQRARKARAKRGPTSGGRARRRRPHVTAAVSPAGEQRATDDRRLPGFDAEALGDLGLTRREIAVLELVAEGRTNEAIAASLEISPLTVKKHLERMSGKLGARNRAALVALAWLRARSALGTGRRRTVGNVSPPKKGPRS